MHVEIDESRWLNAGIEVRRYRGKLRGQASERDASVSKEVHEKSKPGKQDFSNLEL
jgi:hypothetical protein